MMFKKGDLVEKISSNINYNEKKCIYLIVSIKEESNKYLASRVFISSPSNKSIKWSLMVNNGKDILFFKYDNFSVLDEKDIRILDYKFYINRQSLIKRIYSFRLNTKNLRTKEHRIKAINAKKLKQNKKQLANMCKSGKIIEPKTSIKGIDDPNYKGYIKIIRG